MNTNGTIFYPINVGLLRYIRRHADTVFQIIRERNIEFSINFWSVNKVMKKIQRENVTFRERKFLAFSWIFFQKKKKNRRTLDHIDDPAVFFFFSFTIVVCCFKCNKMKYRRSSSFNRLAFQIFFLRDLFFQCVVKKKEKKYW